MAINPLITMGVKPINLDFSDRRLRNAHSDLYEQQADASRQAAEQAKATEEALKQLPANFGQTDVDNMMRVKPTIALQMGKVLGDRNKQALEAQKLQLDAINQARLIESTELDNQRKQFELGIQKTGRLVEILTPLAERDDLNEDDVHRAIGTALATGAIGKAEAETFLKRPFTVNTRSEIAQMLNEMRTGNQRLAVKKEIADDYMAILERKKKEQEVSAGEVGADGLTRAERNKQNEPTAEQKNFRDYYATWLESKGLPKNAQNEMLARKAYQESQRTPVPGVDVALPKEVEAQRIRMNPRQASGTGAAGAGVGDDDPMLKAVLANPLAFDSLTLKQKERLIPALQRNGFDQFGKPLTSGQIDKLSDNGAVIGSLQDLRKTLQENEQFIGPIAGFAAYNPYSDAKKAEAKINLVRQRVGKVLEGGVLRKEDEEKYKLILATLRDNPELAIAKVDGIISTIERDMQIYRDQLRASGRRMPSEKKAEPGPATHRFNPATGKIEAIK
jgi:hypothetical protein